MTETTNKAEVDFILDKNTEVIPIEVKYRKLSAPSTSIAFQNFVSAYHPARGYVIHLGDTMQKNIHSTAIQLMNWSQWMFEGE